METTSTSTAELLANYATMVYAHSTIKSGGAFNSGYESHADDAIAALRGRTITMQDQRDALDILKATGKRGESVIMGLPSHDFAWPY